jgi:hypothetical protein
MTVCESCKRQASNEQPDTGKSFPAFTFLGGLVGTMGLAATGTLLWVPASIVTGALADGWGRRCEICNNEIGDDEDAYLLMEELGDDSTGRRYRPASGPPSMGPACRQQPRSAQPPQTDYRPPRAQDASAESQHLNLDEDDTVEPADTTFREQEGKLVPADAREDAFQDESDLTAGLIPDPDPDGQGEQPLGSDGGIEDSALDSFARFDDPVTNIETPDWLDYPPLEDYDHE